MTCDFIKNHIRCGSDTVIERDFYHPHDDEYVGQPDSPFPLELCEKHENEEITWEMITENNNILLSGRS